MLNAAPRAAAVVVVDVEAVVDAQSAVATDHTGEDPVDVVAEELVAAMVAMVAMAVMVLADGVVDTVDQDGGDQLAREYIQQLMT